ncbi:type II toxin-antitoxin system MqsR family toxin [Pseudomonas sp. MF6755]|uniref:type II toxin-antitoxin system MqsR family toxin n=1 Tax=Pseudomonas sp. MF6755 TaxID=2797530 RepID=UPI0018E85978|nr:type II toxin-antitoxin system MqsR family toxin [Pseudomonas sp. MF6755]MBJ2284323.1 type II toxin-antitoxin system MqsR family toxin [Pseudomonas sp. MF6755]
MEKYTPHYDLAVIKADARRLGSRAFTRTAKESGEDLGFSIEDMQLVIYELQNRMLYKSMTTYGDHRTWQDVYYTYAKNMEIYIKVTYRTNGRPPVISFKERQS